MSNENPSETPLGKTEKEGFKTPRHRISSSEQTTIDEILSKLTEQATLVAAA